MNQRWYRVFYALCPFGQGDFCFVGGRKMINIPMDIDRIYPVRKSKKQKQAFREDIAQYVATIGYNCTVEKGSMGANNLVIGDPEKAKYLVTAHYDTPASIGIPNFITPSNFFCFIVYQLLIVGLFFLLAFLVGFGVSFLTEDRMLIFWSAYISYFGALLLMMFGPANRHNSNDNTSGVVTVLETARTLPENLRDKVCFVLFDLEEAGLVGSASYRKKHKKITETQIVLNLDCVGDGDEIVFFPTAKLQKNEAAMTWLSRAYGKLGSKSIAQRKKGFAYYPSDQANFPLGVGICALRRNKLVGLYMNRIHTAKDTILEETNVNILRAALTTLISNDAAK